MKLLLDQHLSHKLVLPLRAVFPGTDHVRPLKLDTSSDDVLWSHAKSNGFTIVSKDADFYERSALFGHPPKVIWLRIGNASNPRTLKLLLDHSQEIIAFLKDAEIGCLELDFTPA